NSFRQIALGIFAFFGRRGDRIETDKREKYRGDALHYSGQTVWHEGRPVLWLYVKTTDRDHLEDHEQLYGDHQVVRIAAFFDADVNQPCCDTRNKERRNVRDKMKCPNYRRGGPRRVCVFQFPSFRKYLRKGLSFREQILNLTMAAQRREKVHGHVFREMDPESQKEPRKIIRPRDRDSNIADCILQQ